MIHCIRRLTTQILFSSFPLFIATWRLSGWVNRCQHGTVNQKQMFPQCLITTTAIRPFNMTRGEFMQVLYRLSTHSLFYVYFFLSVLQTNRILPKHKHMQINLYWNQSALITKQTSVVQLHNEWLLWVFCFYWIKDMLHNQYSLMPKWMTLMNLFSIVNQKQSAASEVWLSNQLFIWAGSF